MENENENVLICADCGATIQEGDSCFRYNGDIICEDCFENNYFICEDCDEVYHIDDGTSVRDRCGLVCENCLESNYTCCDDCGEYYDANAEGVTLYDNTEICGRCYDNGEYYYCESCNDYYHGDDIEYVDDVGEYLCTDCARNYFQENYGKSHIYEYHAFSDWQLYKTDNEKKFRSI